MANILLVDDDRVNVTMIKQGLKKAGYQVDVASDGQEGLSFVDAGIPDLIVLDVQMPNMGGFEFMNELKAKESVVPVIMLTANENMQDLFITEGVKGYLVKPVKLHILIEKISEIVPVI